jgi:hypothetical protein
VVGVLPGAHATVMTPANVRAAVSLVVRDIGV